MTLPNYVIIGAVRSGTTSLARYLGEHPDAYMAEMKEVHFFDFRYDRGTGWYEQQFDGADGATAIGEASPNYIYWGDETLQRMQQTLPNARFIAVLRDPVDRAWSHYWFSKARGTETLSFADAIAAEPERLATGTLQERLGHSYLDRGRYVRQLERVVHFLGRDRIKVLLFDDLTADPASSYQDVCRFIGIDDSFLPVNLGRAINPAVQFRSTRLRNMRLWRRLPSKLPSIIGRLNTREEPNPTMDPSMRARLVAHFEADNHALAAWLGRDLSAWME